MSDTDDSILELKDSDKDEILDHFGNNYQKVISNFQNYCDQRIQMSNVLNKMNAFESKIDKVKKSNLYDIREINNKTNLILNLSKLQKQIMLIKNNVVHAQKAIMSIKQDKHAAAIRSVNKFDQQQLSEFVQNIQHLVIQKSQQEANNKIQQWVEKSKQQHIEMGLSVLQNCEQMMMINSQFARISLFQPDQRSSIVINRQSSIGRQSLIRQSVTQNNRVSFFQQYNKPQNNNQPRQSFLNQSIIEQSQIIQENNTLIEPNVWDFQIDFAPLKLPQLIYDNLNQRLNFYQELKQTRIKFLQYICSQDIRYTLSEFRNYQCCILGFVLMDLELDKQFKEYDEMNSVLLENVKLMEKQIKATFLNAELRDLLQIKKEVQLFSIALAKLHQYQLSNSINKCLNDQFVVYSNRRIEEIKIILTKSISLDNGSQIVIKNKEQHDQLCTILQCQQNQELQISQFVQDAIFQINQFIEGSILYLTSLNDYFDQNVIFFMDTLFIQICDIIKNYIQQKEEFMLVVQATLNFNYLEQSIQYYKKQIENLLQVTQTKEMECLGQFKNTKYICEESLQNAINQKINLTQLDWCPNIPNKGPHDQFIMINGYYESIIGTLQMMVPQFVEQSIYLTFKQLNKILWKQLLDTKYFNMIGLINIEVDLKSFLQVCNKQTYPESIKEFIQFLNLFIIDTPSVYLDQTKRQANYGYLGVQKIMKMFPKYKKIVYGKLPVVRKRDVDAVFKKIQENLQAF